MSKKKLIQIITALLIMLSIGKFLIWGINDLMTDIEVGDDLSSSKPFSALNYHLLDLDDDINYVILFDDIRNTSIIYDNEGNYLNTIDLLSEGRLEVVEISNNGEILFYQHKRYDQYILVNVNGTVLDIYEEDEPETKIALVKRIKNDNIDASTSNYIVFWLIVLVMKLRYIILEWFQSSL